MTGKRMLIDTSKCTACRACQVACKQWHSLEAEDTTFTGSYQNPPERSGANLTLIKFTEKEIAGKLRFLFFNDRCRHCDYPPCKDACPLGAITRKNNGIVRINPVKCKPDLCSTSDTKPCQQVCMFNVPKRNYKKNGSTVTTVMRKCDFCYNRYKNTDLPVASQKPSCEVTCPPGAILTGAADRMWTRARKRARYLRQNGYPNANVYPKYSEYSHVIWVLLEAPGSYEPPIPVAG